MITIIIIIVIVMISMTTGRAPQGRPGYTGPSRRVGISYRAIRVSRAAPCPGCPEGWRKGQVLLRGVRHSTIFV